MGFELETPYVFLIRACYQTHGWIVELSVSSFDCLTELEAQERKPNPWGKKKKKKNGRGFSFGFREYLV